MFFEPPAPETLAALGIPLSPTAPQVSALSFKGTGKAGAAYYRSGGSFSFTSTVNGVYQIVISRDGVNFDPTNPQNRVLRGTAVAGAQTVTWDGKDNSDAYLPIKSSAYPYRMSIHGGEYHLPFVDVENNIQGGPSITLLNPPQGVCPPLNGGCSAAFYDDRGLHDHDRADRGHARVRAVRSQPARRAVQRPRARLRHDDQPARLRDRHGRQHQRAVHRQLR